MNHPKVSVVIPTYGGADYLTDAIRSVLAQTWQDFELIIVNDASPDDTDKVVGQFQDPRIRYIRHETNRGVANARKTGVMASSGEIIAHLDQDDFYHPDKLRIHVEFLDQHPEIGFTYNSRFELYPSSCSVREILRPSPNLTLADFVLSFPLAPSVWVQRREWATREEIWEERTFYRGREIVICGRLFMAGCKFAMIDRVLNYRRYHRDRRVNNIPRQCEAERICQQIIFDDPRCPPEVRVLKDAASSNIYTMWAYVAYLQDDYETGRHFLREAVRLTPSLLDGTPPPLVNELIVDSIDDEGSSLEEVSKKIFENLPQELAGLAEYHPWAVTRGYLMQGVRALMWNRASDADEYFSHITPSVFQVDDPLMQWLISHLLAYESEYGKKAVLGIIRRLASRFERLGITHAHRTLEGAYFSSRVFDGYRMGAYDRVWSSILRLFVNQPYLLLRNKGLVSVLLHTIPFFEYFIR